MSEMVGFRRSCYQGCYEIFGVATSEHISVDENHLSGFRCLSCTWSPQLSEALQYAQEKKLSGARRQRDSMTQEQLEQMRGCVTHPKIEAKTVKVTCNDGDILEGFVEFICDEERDVVFQLQSSSNPARYKRGTTTQSAGTIL
jgi:hypothetical protein